VACPVLKVAGTPMAPYFHKWKEEDSEEEDSEEEDVQIP